MKHCTTCQFVFADTALNCPHDNTQLRFVRELEPGMIIRGKYHIMQWIGAGGMAAVYRAKHRLLNEMRAIKVVLPRYASDEDFLKRFRHEAAIARKLRHENAVWVEDLDEIEDGRPFIAMEFLEGTDLRSVIQKEGPLPVQRSLLLAEQVASALSAAHKIGITHRDIKPDNIFLTRSTDGREIAKVLDFGIAKVKEGTMDSGFTATKTGILLGTPQYISPEQAIGKVGDKLDGRADLYSLGIVIYEMLTGRIPFESDTPMGMLLQHVSAIPRPPHELCPQLNIPHAVSLILMKCLEKDRDKRFQTADELIRALRDPDAWMAANFPARQVTPPPPPMPQQLQATVVVPQEAVTEALKLAPNRGQGAQANMGQGSAMPQGTMPLERTLPQQQPQSQPQQQPQYPQALPKQQPQQQQPPWQTPDPGPRTMQQTPPPPKRTGLIIALIVVVICVAGGLYWIFSPNGVSDADLREKVVGKFHESSYHSLQEDKVSVRVNKGIVTLSGEVADAPDKDQAANLAWSVSGVKHVDNDISVTPKPTPVPTPRATPRAIEEETPRIVERETPRPHPTVDSRTKELGAWIDMGNAELNNAENPNYNKAISDFKQALLIDPNNRQAQNGLRRAQSAKAAEERLYHNR